MAGVPWASAGAGLLGLAMVLVATLPLAAGAPETDRPPEWRAMEARGARIGEVDIQVLPVFDTTVPAEDTWIGRLANRIHVPTREAVVRRALLFQPGSRVLAREVYESERILRALPFVKDAHIRLEPMAGGQVRARVQVRDSWTLQVDASFQQVGGQASSTFGVTDQNFLGTGKTVGASMAKNHERTDSTFSYRDPQLFGSRLTLEADYGMLTDGYNRRMALRRPFFALQTPWSASLEAQTRRSNLAVYDHSRAVYQTGQWTDTLRATAAWAVKREDDRVWRAGVGLSLDDRRYGEWLDLEAPATLPAPPLANRRRRGPALLLEYVQDAYRSFQDIQGMDTPEDYNLAWGATLELGGYSRRLGSSQPGPYAKATATKGWAIAPGNLTLFKGRLEGRGGGETTERLRLDTSVATYLQFSPRSALAGYLGYRQISRPDPENLLYLGAAEGLRGYHNQLQVGDRQAVLSLEQRFFTQQRWWGIFRLGYMVFVDAGAVHRTDGTGWSPVYPDLGVGLRLGDLKSSIAKVLALTVSVPVQPQRGQARWQWGIQNAVQF